MKKFLATVRRIFLAGSISLLLIIILFICGYPGFFFKGTAFVGTVYLWFSLLSPISGLLFWIISTIYIRKKGQSAAYQQTIKFRDTMVQMFKSDISSPFRLIAEQFVPKKKLIMYYNQITQIEIATMLAEGSKAINREKLLRMIFRFFIYVFGIMTSVNVLRK